MNSYLQEDIFIEQPEGFETKGQEEKVYCIYLYWWFACNRKWWEVDRRVQGWNAQNIWDDKPWFDVLFSRNWGEVKTWWNLYMSK